MNKNIFIVLFVFSVLLNVYFFFSKNTSEKKTETQAIHSTEATRNDEKEFLLDSIRKLMIERSDLKYFDIQENRQAQDYFFEMGIDNPTELITSAILETNTVKGQHPLIRFSPKNNRFQTNKIKILNHKWVICDFSDGVLWGELLLRYHINDDKKVEFIVLDDLLYPEESE